MVGIDTEEQDKGVIIAHGVICHIEFPTTDAEKTRTFYEEVFGWTFSTAPGFDTYPMFRDPSGVGGAFNGDPKGGTPSQTGPIVHIEVENIDATLKQIEQAGGKTMTPKTKISEEYGSFAVFLDNVGNRLGMWSSE